MLETEFIKSLQCNYERVHLAERPDDRRYQYCILTRGGIKGLLPCSLRYINGETYLYYDITSKQNMAQLCSRQLLDRKWVQSFFRSLRLAQQELDRFLLEDKNILVYPEHIFQDVGNKNFYFLYLPYSEEENGMRQFVEFLLEHMDYEDERLVECVYSMYEQMEKSGEAYLQKKVFEDVELLADDLGKSADAGKSTNAGKGAEAEKSTNAGRGVEVERNTNLNADEAWNLREPNEDHQVTYQEIMGEVEETALNKTNRIGLWQRLSGKKKKAADRKQSYREAMLERMEGVEGAAVAESMIYEEEDQDEDYGQTVYMERSSEENRRHKLYTPDGRVAGILEGDSFLIGKQKEDVNLVLDDESVSRIHARISVEGDIIFLEDLNSTNGTFKNGLRLQPYEKRRIGENDEIRFGKLLFVFR
ncbi:MAG: FHA domain-containing protein [Lachnospiraceae bacterium]|nr:FHA domain-containing protein [Lachnospiraceae bacterium]